MGTASIEDREVAGDLPPRQDRRQVATAAVIAAVVVVVAAWWVYAGQQRSAVTIGFDAVPIDCSTGDVTVEDLEFEADPFYVHVVDATADMHCQLRVHVENEGRSTARIREIAIPFYGPATGASIQAQHLSPLGVEPETEDAEEPMLPARDAIYLVDYPIEPGGRVLLTIQLRFAPDGCMSPDATMSSGEPVLLRASVLGRSGWSTTAGPTFAQRGTQDSSCDE